MSRIATIQRHTAETQISVTWNLDGTGQSQIETGIGFFDHMLTLFAKHGAFDLSVKAVGDLHVDQHHTVEIPASRSDKHCVKPWEIRPEFNAMGILHCLWKRLWSRSRWI